MNWLIIGPLSKSHMTAWSIIRALHSLEEEVFAIESRLHRPLTVSQLTNATIKSRKIDYVLIVDFYRPEIFDLIPKSKNYKKIFWSFDSDPRFKPKIQSIANFSDFFFSMCPQIAEETKNLCKNAFFLPQAADHFLYKPVERSKFEYDLTFIGSNKPGRVESLEALKHLDIHVFGESWNKVFNFPIHEAVYGPDFNKLCSNSKIILNLLMYKQFKMPERTLSQKIFMILATKSFCLTEPIKGLDSFFDSNEIGVLNSIKDINYYLEHDQLRTKIAENGYRKVLKCHTYIHRMKEMMKILQS